MIDLVGAGNFVYALSPGNATTKAAVTVFDISGGQGSKFIPSVLELDILLTIFVAAKQIQNFNPQGVTDSAQGMTFV